MTYDLIIVGGGLVGAGLAAALNQAELKVALIDAKLPSQDDARLFALNRGSCHFLAHLGLWPALKPYASPMQQIHVSQQGRFGSVRLQAQEVKLPSLGFVLPAFHIERALNESLHSLSHVTVFRPAQLKKLEQTAGSVQLSIETKEGRQVLQAKLVIGADGTTSTVRDELQIKTIIHDYHQSALVTRTQLEQSHQQVAYERFLKQGAIAMLPLINQECATIWTADTQAIQALADLSDQAFVQALQDRFGYRLKRLLSVSKRHVYPLRMVKAEQAVKGRVFLLGNAAHTLHPIAAQGFNLAIYEVATLVDGIMEKRKQHSDFSASDLAEMSALTRKQQSVSMGVSHGLSQLFSSEAFFAGMATQIGMAGFDIAKPIKKLFIENMMGLRGKVPHLLLGAQAL